MTKKKKVVIKTTGYVIPSSAWKKLPVTKRETMTLKGKKIPVTTYGSKKKRKRK